MSRNKRMLTACLDPKTAGDVAAAMAECFLDDLRVIRLVKPRITSSLLRQLLRRSFETAIDAYFQLPNVPRPAVPEPGTN